ncbi:MAG: ABC transporter permease [Chloroflexi bacterium]|nr:ABC transporter permease [Chloroflexota bacterium]
MFATTLLPSVLAFRQDRFTRGWILALLGNLIIILTIWLPSLAAEDILDNFELFYSEPTDTIELNPRVVPSAAMAMGIFGGYIVLFSGIVDLKSTIDSQAALLFSGLAGIVVVVILLLSGSLDVYSVMVEYQERGDLLDERLIEHITFVSVSLIVGTLSGIGLGLWASRDERLAPVILYAVGIIQTIPSLALFGLLLAPLARLGDRTFSEVLGWFVVGTVIAIGFFVLYRLLYPLLTATPRTVMLALSALAMFIPLALFIVILVSFTFRIVLLALTESDYSGSMSLFVALLFAGTMLWAVRRAGMFSGKVRRRYAMFAIIAIYIISLLVLGQTLYRSSEHYLRNVESLDALTVRDLGVSGIGVAPALLALTLYSLLPLVRNTYAGLNNVDPAIIDSGRGMGMTATQIFFRIELPLAFPIIMAGIRNAGVALVGIGTVAVIIGAGGLGEFVLQGIVNTSLDRILLGTIPAILLAYGLDAGLRGFEQLVVSPGIRQTAQEV